MSKKHFIALAQYIKANRYAFEHGEALPILASYCAEMNPRFDRARWFGYINGTCGPNGGKVNP